MHALLCSHCNRPRGQHQAWSYHCPDGSGFHPTQKFTLAVQRLACDANVAASLKSKPLPVIEQEIARRIIKQFEQVFQCYDLHELTYTKEDILAGIDLMKRGYKL